MKSVNSVLLSNLMDASKGLITLGKLLVDNSVVCFGSATKGVFFGLPRGLFVSDLRRVFWSRFLSSIFFSTPTDFLVFNCLGGEIACVSGVWILLDRSRLAIGSLI